MLNKNNDIVEVIHFTLLATFVYYFSSFFALKALQRPIDFCGQPLKNGLGSWGKERYRQGERNIETDVGRQMQMEEERQLQGERKGMKGERENDKEDSATVTKRKDRQMHT